MKEKHKLCFFNVGVKANKNYLNGIGKLQLETLFTDLEDCPFNIGHLFIKQKQNENHIKRTFQNRYLFYVKRNRKKYGKIDLSLTFFSLDSIKNLLNRCTCKYVYIQEKVMCSYYHYYKFKLNKQIIKIN